jgi:peroxiredoxin
VVVILGDTLEKAQSYAQILHLPFPVLADPERLVYAQYQLQKAAFIIQRTASILIDRQGIIQYIKTTSNPMTWLSESQALLNHARRLSTPESLAPGDQNLKS